METSKDDRPTARPRKKTQQPDKSPLMSVAPKNRQSVRKSTSVRPDTKQRILDSALKEFSTKGYDGARVDDIMRLAEVSKNLIYHYFDSKERLFITVLEAAYENLHAYQRSWTPDPANATDGIRQLVRFTFKYWENSSDFINLLNSENIHRGEHLRKSRLTKENYSGLLDKMSHLLKQGEESGEFRKAVDPVELYISISALAYHYLSNRYTLAYLLDRRLSTDSDKKNRITHIEDLILGFLRDGAKEQA